MNDDTIKLLKECSSGCKMAIESMRQVQEYVKDDSLRALLKEYQEKHETIENEVSELLHQVNEADKKPDTMASAFSWFTTEMKMLMHDDSHQIAKIMMDGCNMGIQSVCEYQNKYDQAEEESTRTARKLVKLEEDFMQKLKGYL